MAKPSEAKPARSGTSLLVIGVLAGGFFLLLLCIAAAVVGYFLLAGRGSASAEPGPIAFTVKKNIKVLTVDEFLGPPGADPQNIIPGTYVIKGTYDLTTLDPVQQKGTIKLDLLVPHSSNARQKGGNVEQIEIAKENPKGSYELKIIVDSVNNKIGQSGVQISYLVGGSQSSPANTLLLIKKK